MKDRLLVGLSRFMVPLPSLVWRGAVDQEARGSGSRLAFMSGDHHRVRDYAVLHLPRVGQPLPPERFAQGLDLPLDRVLAILDELEKGMTFLYRNDQGAVHWAYPVTVERTPHHVTFSTGERVNAA
jgi:hypothetical protein